MNNFELRKKFEMTELFKKISKSVYDINYRQYGGYHVEDTPYFYLNGAFEMFKEMNK